TDPLDVPPADAADRTRERSGQHVEHRRAHRRFEAQMPRLVAEEAKLLERKIAGSSLGIDETRAGDDVKEVDAEDFQPLAVIEGLFDLIYHVMIPERKHPRETKHEIL